MSQYCRIIILAAGSSERLGRPKQLLSFRGSNLIRHVVMAASEASDVPPIVVTGGYEEMIGMELKDTKAEMVFNPDWQTGLASSIIAGVRQAQKDPDLGAVLIVLSDQPFVSAALFGTLIRKGFQSPHAIIASRYGNGTIGTPVLFRKELFHDLLKLTGQEGARKIVRSQPDRVETVDFPLGGIDIDTMDDYTNLLTLHGSIT